MISKDILINIYEYDNKKIKYFKNVLDQLNFISNEYDKFYLRNNRYDIHYFFVYTFSDYILSLNRNKMNLNKVN